MFRLSSANSIHGDSQVKDFTWFLYIFLCVVNMHIKYNYQIVVSICFFLCYYELAFELDWQQLLRWRLGIEQGNKTKAFLVWFSFLATISIGITQEYRYSYRNHSNIMRNCDDLHNLDGCLYNFTGYLHTVIMKLSKNIKVFVWNEEILPLVS